METEKRLIDANEVIRETESILNFRIQHHMPTIEYEALLGYLKKRPTVDAVEVIRCKGCEHWRCNGENMFAENYGICVKCLLDTREDFYCGFGERKTDV